MLKVKTSLDIREEWVQALLNYKGIQCLGWPVGDNGQCAISVLNNIVLQEEFFGVDYNYLATRVGISKDEITRVWHMNDGAEGYRMHSFKEIAAYIQSLPV
jgi:hypothetical protein